MRWVRRLFFRGIIRQLERGPDCEDCGGEMRLLDCGCYHCLECGNSFERRRK